MDALTGVDGSLGAIDPRQAAQLRLDRLRAQAEAGELDNAKLQERLRSVFGDDGEGIAGEDGSVYFERLQNLIGEQGTARLILALTTRLDSTDVRTDVVEGGNDIRANIVERNQAIARERLREEFGTDAERFIDNQGAIDFEALREFLEQRHAGVVNVGPIPSAANIATLRVELPSFMRSSSYSS